ncbi:MAG: hypothetical protein ACRDRJ_52605 [Streptosporangiaceae bacterium]
MNAAPSTPHDAPEPGPAQPAPAASGTVSRPGASRALLTMVIDIVVPIAVFYGVRGAGGSVWLALALGAVAPAASAVAGLVRGRRPQHWSRAQGRCRAQHRCWAQGRSRTSGR